MKISLILATVGRTSEIGRCLRSLALQTDRNFEVLLVDQNQDERLQVYVQEALMLGLVVTHLRLPVPSLSGARNLGILHATGEVIGLTDDDCWYEPEAIAEIRKQLLFDQNLAGVVACWVEQAEAKNTLNTSGSLSLNDWRRFRGGDASSISLFFKKNLFARLGGFDERFGIGQWFGAAEETDFVLRVLADGASLAHCPKARVHHVFSSAPQGPWLTLARNARKRARGTGGIYAKHKLDTRIVIRGLIAPVFVPLMRGKLSLAIRGGYISLGRLEGFFSWKRSERA
jgi:GT2 family glycosyltransferase